MRSVKCEVRSVKYSEPADQESDPRLCTSHFVLRTSNFRAAFTLIELMLVASLVGLVVLSGATLLAQVGGARTRLAGQMDRAAEGDAALRAVTGALRHALRPVPDAGGDAGRPLFEVIQDEVAGRPADRLRFETLDGRPVRPGQPEGDVREVAFSLEAVDPDAGAGGPNGPFVLRRRLDPTRNEGEGTHAWPGEEGGGVVDRLAGGLAALEIACFDGELWTRDWPATLGRYPVLVRVRLALVVNADTQRTEPVERTVAFPWRGKAPAGAGADETDAAPEPGGRDE